MKVPLMDLWAQHRPLEPALVRAFRRSLRSSDFILGAVLERFERAFARATRARFAVGVANGTDAIRLALLAAGVEPGDEVIVPAHTFAATAHAVVHAGARPRFVDVDPETATLDPAAVQAAVGARTRAIVPVHLYGHPADMTAIGSRRGIAVIEDCAQAHGARWRGRPVGSFGDFGAFSFYPSKNLGALGDGGAVVGRRGEAVLRMLRNVGQRRKNRHERIGYNCRLDAVQAAFLEIKLKRLDAWNRARRRRADWYRELIRHPDVSLPVERRGARHVYHLFVVRARRRDALQRHLASAGIASLPYYPTPVPLQPSMRAWRGRFPAAEAVCRENLAIPMYPELTRAQVEHVARVLNRW